LQAPLQEAGVTAKVKEIKVKKAVRRLSKYIVKENVGGLV